MIYLTNGNMPLNAAYSDEIVQEDNSTYQLSFRFPTSDPLWEKLKEEAFLTADDLHGEQEFVIFEVEKKHGYIQVYANQVFTILNNYVVNPISLDRQTGSTALSRFAGSITRDNPFSFFSDIEDRHTFNVGSKNAMEAFAKDKHSIIGQWGGDLVRHGYQVRLLKNGGSENESLFMYKKNLSSYQHKTSTKSLKTRITFIATVKGEGEKAPDRTFTVTIDSPLINKYSQIYEDVIEVNDQDVKDEASLRKYGEQYYRTSLCDMMEDSLEIEVVGQSDVPVQMFDVVSIFHEQYNLDVRKKITKYTYSPMAKKLKSIGFGQFQSGLANAIGNAVSDAVKGEAQQLQSDFERQLARELKNADLAFERHKEELVNQFTDGLNAAKTKAEEVKQELSDNIDQRFSSFNNGPLQEVKRRAEEALQNAGASSLLAKEAQQIGFDAMARLEAFKDQTYITQSTLTGDLDALKQTVNNEVNQTSEFRRMTTDALSRMTGQMNGFATKSEVKQDINGLTQTFAKMKVGGRNYAEDYDFSRGLWQYSQGDSSPKDWTILNGEYNVQGTTKTWKQLQIYSKEGSRTSGKNSTALLELEIGETYTLSFQGICYSGSPNVWVSLRANQTSSENPEIMYGNFNLTSSWQTYQVTIPALIKPDNFDFWRIILGYNGIGHVAFRKVELTRSSTRIDAGPAPEDGRTDLIAAKAIFERTAQGLRIDLSAIQSYVDKDGQRQEELKSYARNESVTRINIYRQDVARNYILRSRYDEDAKSIRQQFEAITNSQNGLIATKIADYKHSVDGKFTDISSRVTTYKQGTDNQISNLTTQVATNKDNAERQMGRISDQVATNKVNVDSQFANVSNQLAQKVETTDFQRVKETSQLYERILGNTENGITDKVARMAMTNQLFQVEVSKNENLKTVQRQLAGSWAVQNLTSAGSIVSQINATNNQILIEAEKIRLKGKTLLDELTAIQGYFKRLFVGEGTFATLNADIIRTNSITADKLVFNEAFANRLVLNEIITSKLVASRAFVNALKAVTIDASQIVTGTLKGDRIYGGTIRGTDIYGATLTGHTQIQLGSYGSFDTVNGGLQINVPRTVNARDGLGVQFIGSYGRGENVPYGLFIYKDADFTTDNYASDSDDFLLTVEGYIKAKGIGWLKTVKGNVGGKDTASIGFWNSDVSLDFGGSGNDIYYRYAGKAYGLWSIINQHFSDRRLKENIVDCKHKALDYIHQFQFKEYDWKKQEDGSRQAHTKIGLIAQEVQAVDPALVYENGDTLNLDNLRLTNIALKAIQELSQRIETLERKLA